MREKTLHRSKKLKQNSDACSLILYNDNFNTFDHVIKSLVEVCGHDYIQAEQCALIVHNHGSYAVKIGSKVILNAMRRALSSKGLNSKVLS